MNFLLIPFTIVLFLSINEIRNFLLFRKSTFLYECCDIKFYRYKDKKDDDNAIAVTSIFFGNAIILLSDHVNDSVIYHEYGHLRQREEVYTALFLLGILFSIAFQSYPFLLPVLLLSFRFFFMHLERSADLYAYKVYNTRYEPKHPERPKNRIERLKAWLFDSHAPDWVRIKDEYYNERKNIIYLFLKDIL
ncbi:conjugal transfer protein [Sulfolobus tengchongensis]|uniref:Conjugal transfer protein n=1 Tax=Sulfolobus tengchongensis TaxID=207809 RepID=A0AAX4L275_9CREN